MFVYPSLLNFLVPPSGQKVVVDNGRYFFYTPPGPNSGNGNYSPVPLTTMLKAKIAQQQALQAALFATGMTDDAISVFLGLVTPMTVGLVPGAGQVITINSTDQVIGAWSPFPFGLPNYIAKNLTAPSSPNFAKVGYTIDALGQYISTGVVLDPGATTVGNAPVIPPDPNTPNPITLIYGIYVGGPFTLADGSTVYQTNQDDEQAEGTIVQWANLQRKSPAAPLGFYQKHYVQTQEPVEGRQGGFLIYYSSVPEPSDLSKVPIG